MVTPIDSLVKYETAILVSSAFVSKKNGQAGKNGKSALERTPGFKERDQDYLNKILPPQEIIENNQLWVRYVSATPATSADVLNLEQRLNKKLDHLSARPNGICPVREELFSQCFDEIIRQITLNCVERGNQLVRVRDEARMLKSSLQQLYDSSIAYGLKKALIAYQSKTDMHDKIKALKKENNDLRKTIGSLEQEEADIIAEEQLQSEKLQESHDADKKTMIDTIKATKVELDKLMSTKLII